MAEERSFIPDPFPTDEEQDRQIELHEGVLKASLENTFQILTPPAIRNQWPEIRVFLNKDPQTVIFDIPRASKYFLLDQLLVHYPTNQEGNTQGPVLTFYIEDIDQALIDKNESADARLFSHPNVDPDPATAGDQSTYLPGINFNRLIRNKGNIKVKIFGFDGTDPEWVDMIMTGRNIQNRRIISEF